MSPLVAVCLKRVVATEAPPRLRGDGAGLRSDEAAWHTDPASLCALAVALQLTADSGSVLAVSVGPPSVEATLQEALAAGAETSLRVWRNGWPREAWEGAPPGDTAHTSHCAAALAAALAERRPHLVLTGAESGDGAHGTFAPMLAARMKAGLAHRAVALEPRGGGWIARVKLERGYTQDVVLGSPAVVSLADIGIRPGRAPLPAWIASRSASIPVEAAGSAYSATSKTAWRMPLPRVKPLPRPAADANAEARIRAMVELPSGSGGTTIPRESGPATQADATLRLLRDRKYLD